MGHNKYQQSNIGQQIIENNSPNLQIETHNLNRGNINNNNELEKTYSQKVLKLSQETPIVDSTPLAVVGDNQLDQKVVKQITQSNNLQNISPPIENQYLSGRNAAIENGVKDPALNRNSSDFPIDDQPEISDASKVEDLALSNNLKHIEDEIEQSRQENENHKKQLQELDEFENFLEGII